VVACFDSSSTPATSAAEDAGVIESGAPRDAGAVDMTPETGTEIPDTSTLDAASEASTPPADAAPETSADASDATVGSGEALSFDGVDDWVHLPAAPGGASEVAFSVALWFRTSGSLASMFEVYASTAGDRFLSINDGQVCFYVYATPLSQVCTPDATYDDGAWHHAAGTLGAGGVNLYVDGALAASDSSTKASIFTTDTDFRIGMGHTSFSSATVFFAGDLDEVRVWSVELSASAIAANYAATIDPSTAGLQGYWKLDETGSSTIAHDATSGAHDGELTNFSFSPSPWISPGAF
jgi:Concanavalin A-like lectin/glucanases superfamily